MRRMIGTPRWKPFGKPRLTEAARAYRFEAERVVRLSDGPSLWKMSLKVDSVVQCPPVSFSVFLVAAPLEWFKPKKGFPFFQGHCRHVSHNQNPGKRRFVRNSPSHK